MRFRQFMDQCIDDDTKKLGGLIKKPAPGGESVLPPDPPVVEPGDIPNLPKDAGDAAPKAAPVEEPADEPKDEKKEEKKKEEPAEKEEKEPKVELDKDDDEEEKKEEKPKDKKPGGLGKKTNESFEFISELRQL